MGGIKGTIFPFGTYFLVVRVSPSGVSAQLTVILLTEAPAGIYRVGLLETILMEHNSGPHLAPHRNLLPSLMYL